VDVGLTVADAFPLDTTTVATFVVANVSSNTATNVVLRATPDANSSVSLGAFLQCTAGTVICSALTVPVDCNGDSCTIASLPAGQSVEMFGLLDASSGSSLPTATVTVTAPGDTNAANDTITLTGSTN
jgi:hypothetical protein